MTSSHNGYTAYYPRIACNKQVPELYEAILKTTEKLPEFRRQTLIRRLETSILELLELFIMTKHAPKAHKTAYLIKATAQVEIVQFQLRILLTQKLANETTLHQLPLQTAIQNGQFYFTREKGVKEFKKLED